MRKRLMLAVTISLLATACSPNPNAGVPILSPPDNAAWQTTKSQLRYCTIHSAPPMAKVAKADSKVTVQYVGAFDDGHIFDSSIERQVPFTFTLGRHQVIKGWEEGIVGMRVGEVRYLIIPPALAFGEYGRGPIPAHTTMHYKIALVSIN